MVAANRGFVEGGTRNAKKIPSLQKDCKMKWIESVEKII